MSSFPAFPAPAGLELPPPQRLFDLLASAAAISVPWMQTVSTLTTAGGLSPDVRELVVLRTASHMRSRYVLSGHLSVGRHIGLSENRVQAALGHKAAEPPDLPLLDAVDELLSEGRIGTATLGQLTACLDPAQILELAILTGHYAGISMVCETFGLEPETPYDGRDVITED